MENIVPHEIERELRDAAPRRVRLTEATQTTRRWLYNGATVLLAIVLFFSIKDVRQLNAVHYYGKNADAIITGKHVSKGKSTSYSLSYLYPAFGSQRNKILSSDARISESQYEHYNVGDTLEITYLPEDPAVNYLGGVSKTDVLVRQVLWTLGIGLCLGVAGIGAYFSEMALRQSVRLLQNGLPVVGTVTERKIIPGTATACFLTYSYTTPSGAEDSVEASVSRPQYESRDVGSKCTLLVNPQDASDSTPYFLMTNVEVEGTPPRVRSA